MKTMTCKQLGGACDQEFQAETFEEMAALSQQHGKEMFQQQDAQSGQGKGLHELRESVGGRIASRSDAPVDARNFNKVEL